MEGGSTRNYKVSINPEFCGCISGEPISDFGMGVSQGNNTVMACFACNRHAMDKMRALIFAYVNIEREGDRERDAERETEIV